MLIKVNECDGRTVLINPAYIIYVREARVSTWEYRTEIGVGNPGERVAFQVIESLPQVQKMIDEAQAELFKIHADGTVEQVNKEG